MPCALLGLFAALGQATASRTASALSSHRGSRHTRLDLPVAGPQQFQLDARASALPTSESYTPFISRYHKDNCM